MNYENKDRELNLKALCFCVARKWKQMLVIAVVLALALGGFRGWKSLSVVMDTQSLEALKATYEEEYAQYQGQVAAFNAQIAQVEADIHDHGVYMEESILMQLDYRNTWVSSVNLYIQTEEHDSVSGAGSGYTRADMIADAYRNTMMDALILEKAAETLDIAPRYLQELISIPLPVYHEYQEGPLVTIMVRSSDAESAKRIMDVMLSYLDMIWGRITNSMGKHTIGVINANTIAVVDEELADIQEDAADRLVDYVAYLEEYRYSLNQLSVPSMPDLSVGSAVKSVIKYAAVGFLGGVFLVAAVACIAYVVGDKLYAAEELKSRFGLPLLGKISLKKKKSCAIDRFLDRCEDRGKTKEQGALLAMSANVRNNCPAGTVLLVAGTAGAEGMQEVAETLTQTLPERTLIFGSDLLESPETIEALGKCDAVLLVERCGLSRYSRIGAQVEAVRNINKQLLGCVVLEK